MKTKLLSLSALFFLTIAISAQETKPTLKQEVKKDAKAVGIAVEDGAEWTGETAKDGVKRTEKTVKKGAKATKRSAKKAARWTDKTAKKGGKAVKEGYNDTKDYIKKETK